MALEKKPGDTGFNKDDIPRNSPHLGEDGQGSWQK
jgi:hypothetical protein